jgi:peptide/nickel transport system permease protein
VVLFVVSIAIFSIVQILPGDIGRLMLGPFASQHDIELVRSQLGLDRPLLQRYIEWGVGFLTGHWGESWRLRVPIAPLVADRFVNSAVLAGFSLLLIVPLSILGGTIAALRKGKLADRIISLVGISLMAMPEFVSSMFLILIFSLWLQLLPSSAQIPGDGSFFGNLHLLIMPACALGFVMFGYISRMVRASVVEELRRGYVRTAWLKGISPFQVVVRHVLPNALLPTITVIANQISWLIGGLVVVENVFNYPGLGQLLLQAALSQDLPMLEVTVLILAAILIVSNLVADILYAVLTPRIRTSEGMP